jgi:hypothetical protein
MGLRLKLVPFFNLQPYPIALDVVHSKDNKIILQISNRGMMIELLKMKLKHYQVKLIYGTKYSFWLGPKDRS